MTAAPTADLRAWIGAASGPDALLHLDARWNDFAALKKPVATLFGAYDTGKSSILRRLLVDSGQPIPDWLTVSARHETAVSSLTEVAGCLVRDTPGLSPDGQDARSLKNSATARATLGLTDLLLVTVTPQLPTGERPELVKILSSEWPTPFVWFLISRADEGTVDPASDQSGYEKWSNQKRDELRASLSLGDNPIHVVVSDYAGLGAFEMEPGAATWEVSRSWDGMAELWQALARFSERDLDESRLAAEHRFWRFAVTDLLEGLRGELDDLTTSHNVAATSLRRKAVFLKSVDALVDAAKMSLGGALDSAIRRALNNPHIDAESIEESVDPVLSEWWHTQQAQLARVRQDAIQSFDGERAGRGWAKFESLYSTYAQPDRDNGQHAPTLTPRFASIGEKVAGALGAMDKVRHAHEAARHPAKAREALKSALSFGEAADLVNAVLPVLTELSGLIEGKVQSKVDKAHERAHRDQVEAEVTRIVTSAADQAMRNLEPDVEALRQEITEQTVGGRTLTDLESACVIAADLLRRGELLTLESEKADATGPA